MNKLFFGLILSLTSGLAFAQNQQVIDSLYILLESNISDKERVDTYINISKEYSNADSAKTVELAKKAIDLAEKVNYQEGKIEALYRIGWSTMQRGKYEKAQQIFEEIILLAERHNYLAGKSKGFNGLGVLYEFRGDNEKSLEYYFRTLNILQQLKDKNGEADAYNNIGLIYRKQGDYSNALDYNLKSLRVYEELDDKRGMSNSFNNIGIINYYLENYEESLESYFKSLTINEEIMDKRHIASDYNNIGFMYSLQSTYEEAINYYIKALEINKELGNVRGEAFNTNNIGEAYLNQGFHTKALSYLNSSLQIRQQIGDLPNTAYTLNKIAEVYRQQKQWKEARRTLKEVLEISQENGYKETTKNALLKLALIEKELGNYRSAYEFHVLHKQLSDSLNNEDLTKKITRLQAEYEFQQEKDSLDVVREKESLVYQTQLGESKNREIFLFIVLLLFVGILTVIFVSNRKIKSLNSKLSALNDELTKQRDLLDGQNKVKSNIFSIISHDLRSPVSSLFSLVYLIRNQYSEIETNTILSDLFKEFDYIYNNTEQLLNNLLNWGLKETESLPLSVVELNVKDTVSESVSLIKPSAQSKNVEIRLDDIDPDMVLLADQNSINLAMRNLLSNAIKYSRKDEGIVEVSASKDHNRVIISISDNGIGMNQETLDHLFEIKKNKSTKGTGGEKGSGVGLKLVRDFVELNQGDISVKSEVGKGSSFSLIFPSK